MTETVEQLIARITRERDQALAHVTELQARMTEMVEERRLHLITVHDVHYQQAEQL